MLMLMRMLTGMLMRMLTRMLMRILSTGADADAITDTNVDVAGVATAQCQCAYLMIALQSPTCACSECILRMQACRCSEYRVNAHLYTQNLRVCVCAFICMSGMLGVIAKLNRGGSSPVELH